MQQRDFARKLRTESTDAERKLWQVLRLKQMRGIKFRRQQILGPYIVDFVSLEVRLIIEIDGGHHAEQILADEKRSAWLAAQGFKVLRFWNNEVLRDMNAVSERIWDVLQSCERRVAPPP